MVETKLAQERRFFDRNIATWLEQESNIGKWALVKGDELIGMYEDFDEAIHIGFEKFGLSSFLVSQIRREANEITTTALMLDEILRDSPDGSSSHIQP